MRRLFAFATQPRSLPRIAAPYIPRFHWNVAGLKKSPTTPSLRSRRPPFVRQSSTPFVVCGNWSYTHLLGVSELYLHVYLLCLIRKNQESYLVSLFVQSSVTDVPFVEVLYFFNRDIAYMLKLYCCCRGSTYTTFYTAFYRGKQNCNQDSRFKTCPVFVRVRRYSIVLCVLVYYCIRAYL